MHIQKTLILALVAAAFVTQAPFAYAAGGEGDTLIVITRDDAGSQIVSTTGADRSLSAESVETAANEAVQLVLEEGTNATIGPVSVVDWMLARDDDGAFESLAFDVERGLLRWTAAVPAFPSPCARTD